MNIDRTGLMRAILVNHFALAHDEYHDKRNWRRCPNENCQRGVEVVGAFDRLTEQAEKNNAVKE